jgi:hypothetical protein
MTRVEIVHETAVHLREFAREAELPGYAEKLERAAIELEKLEVELRRPAGPSGFQINAPLEFRAG